jgi:hypothetical protein
MLVGSRLIGEGNEGSQARALNGLEMTPPYYKKKIVYVEISCYIYITP